MVRIHRRKVQCYMRAYHYTVCTITYIIEIMRMLTWVSEGSSGTGAHVRTTVMTEEVRVERSGPVTELELDLGRTGKVRETGLLVVQRPGTHVQRETAHFPRTPVERSSAHGRQLFQPPLFAPLVLEPHLRKRPKTLCYLFSTRQRMPIIILMKHYNYSHSKGRTPHARKTHLFCTYIICKVLCCIQSRLEHFYMYKIRALNDFSDVIENVTDVPEEFPSREYGAI